MTPTSRERETYHPPVSGIISGINWAVQNMQTNNRVGKASALLAVGGAFSTALNNAVQSASNAGLFFAVPAGDDASSSPGTAPSACTVGATTISDSVASFSNYGTAGESKISMTLGLKSTDRKLVDIWAPGANIVSIWITSNTAINTLSGTSLAAAHIAGLGAYFLALEGPRTPVALCERLRQVATPNVLTGVPSGSPNLLAYNLSGL